MRVVAGSLGGRRLVAPRDRATRPTADRVKEALFSILGDVRDLAVLDLYAGTGALGIEALSRGAARACFVESARDAHDALRKNVAELALVARATILRSAVEKSRKALEQAGPFDLVLADPPYAEAAASAIVVASLARDVAPRATIVIEHAAKEPLDEVLERARLERVDLRTYGDTALAFFRHAAPPA